MTPDSRLLDYIEETSPIEVRQLLIAAYQFLQENLPPFATCTIKWRMPFYKLHRNYCYLNRHRDHITLGFSNGYKLSPLPDILLDENGKLKQIRYLEIRSIEDLYSDITQQVFQEAIIVDEMLAKKKSQHNFQKRKFM